jgi:TusA-related sulfurtransferase
VEIDARGLRHPEPLVKLKEALEDPRSVGEPVYILVDSRQEVKRIEAFAAFSHHLFETETREDHWRVRIDRMCNC